MPIDIAQQTDAYHTRDKDSFKHAHEVTKPYGQIDDILTWAKVQLVGEWRWQLVELSSIVRPGRYIFYFDSEKDYLTFVLKWS